MIFGLSEEKELSEQQVLCAVGSCCPPRRKHRLGWRCRSHQTLQIEAGRACRQGSVRDRERQCGAPDARNRNRA